jgi:hypothetical protein
MRRVLERQRCTCDAKTPMEREGEDDVRYDRRTLRVVRLRCPTCAATRSMYFELR